MIIPSQKQSLSLDLFYHFCITICIISILKQYISVINTLVKLLPGHFYCIVCLVMIVIVRYHLRSRFF